MSKLRPIDLIFVDHIIKFDLWYLTKFVFINCYFIFLATFLIISNNYFYSGYRMKVLIAGLIKFGKKNNEETKGCTGREVTYILSIFILRYWYFKKQLCIFKLHD